MGTGDVDSTEVFWPISRGLLRSEGNNTTEVHRLRSLVVYQILFGGRLIIRDSDYVNSLAFRSSVIRTLNGTAEDNAKFFRTLLDERYLLIACRTENSLGEVAERLGKAGGGGHSLIRPEWYRSDAADLVYLESRRSPEDRGYSVKQAADYYTQQIQAMLGESLEPYVDDRFRLRALERTAALVEQHRTLSWAFFLADGAFWEGFSENEREKYNHFFYYVLGQAPHAGFMPDALGLSPIYMQDAADAIELWRGRLLQKKELIGERTIKLGAGFSFSDYIEYLCLLPFDALVALTNSEESAAFRHACELFSRQKLTLREVESAYRDFRKVIDSELLRHHLTRPKSGIRTDLRAFLREARDEAIGPGVDIVCHEVLGAAVPFWHLALTLFYRAVRGEWPEERKTRLARESTGADIAGEIQRLQDGREKLSESIVFDRPGVQDRLIKLESRSVNADVCVTRPDNSP